MADVSERWTETEWNAEGERRFGPDRESWAFRCPMCGNEMSIARARAEFPELRGSGWRPEAECIGRYIDVPAARMENHDSASGKTKPCDWCAYGLFGGPWTVVRDGVLLHGKPVESHVFAFAAPREGT